MERQLAQLVVPTGSSSGSSAAKKQRDEEFEDELPRKKRLAAESDSEDSRCENDGGVRGDSSGDSSHLCSRSDELDSVESFPNQLPAAVPLVVLYLLVEVRNS